MSYLTQRLANLYPLWSTLRSDPSSFGHRFLGSFAEAFEAEEIGNLRLAHLNEVLMSGTTVFDFPYFSFVDMQDIGMSLFPNGIGGEANFPSITFQDATGLVTIVLAESLDDFYYSVPTELMLDDDHELPNIEIWNSDPAEAALLGLNDNGKVPTGLNDALHWQLPFEEAPHLAQGYRLGVSLKDSTIYKRFGEENGDDLPYLGHHKILIRGIDETGLEIEDEIQIFDDGYFLTKHKFIAVKSIGVGGNIKPAVQFDGFNGSVSIQLTDINHNTKTCPFHAAVTADSSNQFEDFTYGGFDGNPQNQTPNFDIIQKTSATGKGLEGPLLMELSEEEGAPGSFLDSYFHLFTNGQMYRRPGVDLEDEADLRELISSQLLLDKFDLPYTAVDFTFNWWDCKCYVLDDTGRVHVYALGTTPFTAHTFPRNKLISVEAKPLTRRAVYGEAIPMWTWHRILRKALKWVTIMRESPAAIAETEAAVANGLPGEPIFRGEYLQQDLTWGPDKYHFLGSSTDGGPAEDSWTDFKFWTDFPTVADPNDIYDTLGQWNFYVEAALQSDRQVELENIEKLHNDGNIDDTTYWRTKEILLSKEEKVVIQRSSTAVMCEYLKAQETYGDGVTPLIDNPVGIYIDGLNHHICLVGETQNGWHINKYKGVAHKWFPDPASDLVLFREQYNFVDITQNGITVNVTPEAVI
tara:strand:+ start:1979 stop:4057 length:2079 start_codon:yes stop_codon:yes gene_type:complete